ncbi:hypothetical protein, partial [Campylobacter coli]|uniref:hypothetical protein n=1 Tax=Campylobacter coli TaxID=195 RepID=UPI00288DFC91
MIPNFIASFDVAIGRKRLRERKGYLKLSNTIAYGGLSVDALALYIQLAKLSEKTIVSEIYLREFIKVKNNQRMSLNRLRIAKKELIELRLLEIKKVRNGSLNFYEWILKDENYQVKKHFNKSLSLLKNSDEKLSKTLKNNASSIDRKLTTENEKKENLHYIETRTHARDNKFINNININNNKFIKKENLENLKNNQEKKERVFNQNASFVVSFLKLDEKECEKMAKKEFKVPNANELMGQIIAFNEKNGTNFGEELANDFIGYWDAREWKRNGKRMSSIAGSLYTWLKYAKENELRKNQRFNRKKEANPSVVDSLIA